MQTGLAKLRNIAYNLGNEDPNTLDEKLLDIAEQIEHETFLRPRFEDGTPVNYGDEFFNDLDGISYVRSVFYYLHNGRISVNGFTYDYNHPLVRPVRRHQ